MWDINMDKIEVILEGAESCCKMLDSFLDVKNVETIMGIMNFSLGLPAPLSLSKLATMEDKDYKSMLFPNGGNLSLIEDMG